MNRVRKGLALFVIVAMLLAGMIALTPAEAYACSISVDKKVNGVDGPITVDYGSTVTYTYKVRANGASFTDITVTDNVLGTVGTLGSLADGASYTFTVSSGVLTADVTNTGKVVGYSGGHDYDDSDKCTVYVKEPSIKLDKTASPTTVNEGQTTTYTYTVTNNGDYDLTSIAVTDDILGAIGTAPSLAKGAHAHFTKVSPALFDDVTNVGTAVGYYGTVQVSDTDDCDVCVHLIGTTIDVCKTATSSWQRVNTYTFGITKKASPTSLNLVAGGASGTVEYDIDVTPTLVTTDTYSVSGTITVHNGGAVPTKGLSIVDTVQRPNWINYVSTNVDVSAKPVLAAGESYSYPYSITFAKYDGVTHYRNEAAVTISNHSGSGGPQSHTTYYRVEFDLPGTPTGTSTVPASVSLSDVESGPGLSWTVTGVTINGTPQASLAGPWTLAAPYAASYDVHITKSVSAAAAGDFVLHNVAAVNGSQAQADVNVHVVAPPSLSITKTGPASADIGGTVNYTITVTNTGGVTLDNIVVHDSLLGDIPVGTLAPGAHVDLTPSYGPVTQSDYLTRNPLHNAAQAQSGSVLSNTATWDVPIVAHPALSIVKTGPASADIGGTVNYTITVTNTGDLDLTGVVVHDTLLGDLAVPGTLAAGGGQAILTPSYGPVTQSDYLTRNPLHNAAQAQSGSVLSNTATWDVPIVAHPALTITKTANVTEIAVGGTVNYTIVVTNTGDLDLTNVHIVDAKLGIDQTLQSLPINTKVTILGSYVTSSADLPSPLVNTANVTTAQTDPSSASASVILTQPISPTATGVITGHKWNDLNGNGQHDAGEPGLAGVTITLSGPGISAQTTTASDGSYSFSNLANGAYTVAEIVPSNMNATSSTSIQVTIVRGETIIDVDFNNMAKQAVGPTGGETGTTTTNTTTTTTLPTTGIDMTPWLLAAGLLVLIGFSALAIGLLRHKRARYSVRP